MKTYQAAKLSQTNQKQIDPPEHPANYYVNINKPIKNMLFFYLIIGISILFKQK